MEEKKKEKNLILFSWAWLRLHQRPSRTPFEDTIFALLRSSSDISGNSFGDTGAPSHRLLWLEPTQTDSCCYKTVISWNSCTTLRASFSGAVLRPYSRKAFLLPRNFFEKGALSLSTQWAFVGCVSLGLYNYTYPTHRNDAGRYGVLSAVCD